MGYTLLLIQEKSYSTTSIFIGITKFMLHSNYYCIRVGLTDLKQYGNKWGSFRRDLIIL